MRPYLGKYQWFLRHLIPLVPEEMYMEHQSANNEISLLIAIYVFLCCRILHGRQCQICKVVVPDFPLHNSLKHSHILELFAHTCGLCKVITMIQFTLQSAAVSHQKRSVL